MVIHRKKAVLIHTLFLLFMVISQFIAIHALETGDWAEFAKFCVIMFSSAIFAVVFAITRGTRKNHEAKD